MSRVVTEERMGVKRNAIVMGRPSTGGGVKVSFRLSAYLITQLGLKKSIAIRNEGSYAQDSQVLSRLISKGIDYLANNPDGEFASLESPRSPKHSHAKKWDYAWNTFNQWLPQAIMEQIKPLLRDGEKLNQLVQRLIVIGCATEGIIQPPGQQAIDAVPDRLTYQGGVARKKKSDRPPIVVVPRRKRG